MELRGSDFDPIDEFTLFWRWSQESHALFLPEELKLIQPLKANIAREVHDALLTADQEVVLAIESTDENDADIEEWLIHLPLDEAEPVILSWTPDTAVVTSWRLFTRRWSDFWYPSSDDLTVASVSMSWVLLIHHYGHFEWKKIKCRAR